MTVATDRETSRARPREAAPARTRGEDPLVPQPAVPPRRPGSGQAVVFGVIAVVAILGGAVGMWQEVLKDHFVPKAFSEVTPGLYRSGQISAPMIGPILQRHGIDELVNLGWYNPENPANMAELRALQRLGIEPQLFNLDGNGSGDPDMYVAALKAIHAARLQERNVLVHCWAGTERTSGAVALYQTLVLGVSEEEAMAEILRFHNPNRRTAALLPYLDENVGVIAQRLVEEGIIERVPDPLPRFVVP